MSRLAGRFKLVQRCGVLSVAILQLKDPFELFIKNNKVLPCPRFLSRSGKTIAVEGDVNTKSLPPGES